MAKWQEKGNAMARHNNAVSRLKKADFEALPLLPIGNRIVH
jgi:hypothetical protein